MNIRIVISAAFAGAALAGGVWAAAEAPASLTPDEQHAIETKLGTTFKNFKFDEIRASELPGVVEIYAGPRLLYYAPQQQILILGEFYSASGASITEEKIGRHAASRADSIDRSSALVVGEGTTELIAFVDPDCRYCRAANQWLHERARPNLREYIFFMPLNGRPQAAARAARALCAPQAERVAALQRVFEPTAADTDNGAAVCEGASARLAQQAEIANKVGVYATPFFIVKGQVIAGFDRERLNSLLSANQTVEGEKR